MKYINLMEGIRFWILVALGALLLICVIYIIGLNAFETISYKRKTKLLQSYGCKRFLKDVPSAGSGAFYGWKTHDWKIIIDERDLSRMTYKHLKEKLKEETLTQ